MTEALYTGILLLFVGMGTVFVVLGMVVATGRMVILSVNRFGSFAGSQDVNPPDAHTDDLSGAKIAAITSAIHTATGGRGQITHIERIEE